MKNYFLSVALFLLMVLPVLAQNSDKYTELTRQAASLYDNRQYKKSAETYTKAFKANGWKAYRADRYNAACAWTLAGNKDSAFSQLFKVANAFKYDNYERIASDSVLTSLTKDPRWNALLNIVKQNIGKDEAKLNKKLLVLMDSVYHDDQAYRFKKISVDKEFGPGSAERKEIVSTIHTKDSLNSIIVSKLLDDYGWLGREVVGSNGNATLALVLMHSDLKVQEKYLPVMRQGVKNKKADVSDLALLEDLVALREGKKQIYGTYLVNGGNKKYMIAPMEDPANVDRRRAELQLDSLDEYLKNWGKHWSMNTYEEDQKLLEHETQNY